MRRGLCRSRGWVLLLVLAIEWLPALAQTDRFDVSIDAGNAAVTLAEFSRQTGVNFLLPSEDIKAVKTHPVRGHMSLADALGVMLKGTPLTFTMATDHAVVIRKACERRCDKKSRGREPGQQSAAEEAGLEEVLVSGSVGASPGVSSVRMTSKYLNSHDIVTAQDFLDTQPQMFGGGPTEDTSLGPDAQSNFARGTGINLRGAGAGRTLVLLDNQRTATSGTAGAFRDVSIIPLAAVDHVDIISQDQSARYGADASGGVVNFALKHRLQGAELNAMFGEASGSTLHEKKFDFAAGMQGDFWNAMLSAGYYRRGDLPADRRDLATSDLTPYGGNNFNTLFGNPGTIIDGGQTWAIPKGQNGQHLTANQLVAGTANWYDRYTGVDILPSEQLVSLLGTLDARLDDRLSWSVDVLLSRRQVCSRSRGQEMTLLVPDTNPYFVSPTGSSAAVTVAYSFQRDHGFLTSRADIRSANLSIVQHYRLSSWMLTGTETLGQQSQRLRQTGGVSTAALADALADPNPATAFNPFGDGTFSSPATLATMSEADQSLVNSYEGVLSVGGEGPVTRLPAGDLDLALEAQWRGQRLAGSGLWMPGTNPINGDLARHTLSAYAQLLVPLLTTGLSRGWARKLDVSAAIRYEHYLRIGGFSNPHVGVEWSPLQGLSMRASWARSHRAPNLLDRTDATDFSQPYVLPDSSSPNGVSTVLALTGGNPELLPETATSWTAGVSWAPPSLPFLAVSMTYFQLHFTNQIARMPLVTNLLNDPSSQLIVSRGITAQQQAAVCAFAIEQTQQACEQAFINIVIDDRVRNLSALFSDGLDFGLQLSPRLFLGALNLGLAGTYIWHYAQALSPLSPVIELVGTQTNPLNLQLRASADLDLAGFGFSTTISYASAYHDVLSQPARSVRSWTTVAAQIRYCPGPGGCAQRQRMQLTVSAQNLLDSQPPFLNNALAGIGYDQENGDLRGRTLRIGVQYRW